MFVNKIIYLYSAPSPPVNVTITETTCNSVTVNWTPPTDNGNAELTQYRVRVNKDGGGRVARTDVAAMNLSYQVSSLEPKTNYTVEVKARNVGDFGNSASTKFVTNQKGLITTLFACPCLYA